MALVEVSTATGSEKVLSANIGDTIKMTCAAVSAGNNTPEVYPAACLGSDGGYFAFPNEVTGDEFDDAIDSKVHYDFNTTALTAGGSGLATAAAANTDAVTQTATILGEARGMYITCGCKGNDGADTETLTIKVEETYCPELATVCGNSETECNDMSCTKDITCTAADTTASTSSSTKSTTKSSSGGLGSGILHAPFKIATALTILISAMWFAMD